jgi:hypothetical protein
MNTARIVVPTIALGIGGIAASPASGFARQAERLAVENISEDQASRRSESVNGVRPRVAILTTAQK